MKLNENQKVTLTLKQLKKLVKEASNQYVSAIWDVLEKMNSAEWTRYKWADVDVKGNTIYIEYETQEMSAEGDAFDTFSKSREVSTAKNAGYAIVYKFWNRSGEGKSIEGVIAKPGAKLPADVVAKMIETDDTFAHYDSYTGETYYPDARVKGNVIVVDHEYLDEDKDQLTDSRNKVLNEGLALIQYQKKYGVRIKFHVEGVPDGEFNFTVDMGTVADEKAWAAVMQKNWPDEEDEENENED